MLQNRVYLYFYYKICFYKCNILLKQLNNLAMNILKMLKILYFYHLSVHLY